tara:strand:- start:100 stop:468 length:369 start_codon:yes stop_codon:yes gene_type:complete
MTDKNAKVATLVITGETRAARVDLKKAGWTYDAVNQSWSRQITQYWVDQIAGDDTRFAALKTLQARKKGCKVTMNGSTVFTSPTYSVVSHHAAAAIGSDNRDANGVYCPSARIPGSAPDDLI